MNLSWHATSKTREELRLPYPAGRNYHVREPWNREGQVYTSLDKSSGTTRWTASSYQVAARTFRTKALAKQYLTNAAFTRELSMAKKEPLDFANAEWREDHVGDNEFRILQSTKTGHNLATVYKEGGKFKIAVRGYGHFDIPSVDNFEDAKTVGLVIFRMRE